LEEIRRCLTTAPVLGCPNFDQNFVLQIDASDFGLGAVLSQDIEGQEKVIAYASSEKVSAINGLKTVTNKLYERCPP